MIIDIYTLLLFFSSVVKYLTVDQSLLHAALSTVKYLTTELYPSPPIIRIVPFIYISFLASNDDLSEKCKSEASETWRQYLGFCELSVYERLYSISSVRHQTLILFFSFFVHKLDKMEKEAQLLKELEDLELGD